MSRVRTPSTPPQPGTIAADALRTLYRRPVPACPRRRQAVVGFITAISVIGVAAGVAALIIALAITNGMRRDLQDRLVGATRRMSNLCGQRVMGIRDWRPLVAPIRLATVPHVQAVAPGLYGRVLISRGPRSGGALIKGIIPTDERRVGELLQSINQGSADELQPVEFRTISHRQ